VMVNNVDAKLEDVAMVTCSSSSPYVIAMLWRYRGEVLSNSSKYIISDSKNMSTLRVVNVTRNDFGSYSCEVTDSVHRTTTATGYLNHTSKYVTITSLCVIRVCHLGLLYFTHKVNSIDAVVGTRATLICTVSGMVGMVTFSWFKDGRNLVEDNSFDTESFVRVLRVLCLSM